MGAMTSQRVTQVWLQELVNTSTLLLTNFANIKLVHEPALREILNAQGIVYETLVSRVNTAITEWQTQIATLANSSNQG